MPQLLSTILKATSWKFEFDASVLRAEPELAALIGEAIAHWASIEGALGNVLVEILGSHVVPGLAMFSVLTSASAQFDTIKAAASAVLTGEALEVFNATMSVVQSVQKQRNKLAHWLWGRSPEVPNALLLIDPVYVREKRVELDQFHGRDLRGVPWEDVQKIYEYDRSKIYVYNKGDLERISRDLEEARQIVGYLIFYLDDPQPMMFPRAELFRWLSGFRLFSEALSRLREGQKTDPQPQS